MGNEVSAPPPIGRARRRLPAASTSARRRVVRIPGTASRVPAFVPRRAVTAVARAAGGRRP